MAYEILFWSSLYELGGELWNVINLQTQLGGNQTYPVVLPILVGFPEKNHHLNVDAGNHGFAVFRWFIHVYPMKKSHDNPITTHSYQWFFLFIVANS